jgi:hypothetical protein
MQMLRTQNLQGCLYPLPPKHFLKVFFLLKLTLAGLEAKVEDTESAGLPLSSASPTLTYYVPVVFYLLWLTLAGVEAKVEDTESAGLPLSSASPRFSC